MNATNSFEQISLVLSIRDRFCDFLPWALSLHCHSIEKNRVHQQCSVWWVDLCEKKLFLCEVVMVLRKYWKRNWTNDCWLFAFKFAKSTLLPNSSKITFNHANVFCLLFVLKHHLLCSHVHCIYCVRQAYGARVRWPTRIITIYPGFLPQFHAPSLITNSLIPRLQNNVRCLCVHCVCRAANSHALSVRLTHFNKFSRSHADIRISHAKKK